jgi:hypothetical protein
MRLLKNYDMSTEKAYIIRLSSNELSCSIAQRCAESCEKVDMPYDFWEAYDGLTTDQIVSPDNLKDHILMNMIKLTNHYMTRTEVACALSHISLWSKCLEIERPIVILEHDAVMVKKYTDHKLFNSICYLGSDEQANLGWGVYLTPPFGSDGHNYYFICRAHAYAIDPSVARSMLAYILKYGITSSLDTMLRTDIFPTHQIGLFAYDVREGKTTIINRESKSHTRNDGLVK